MWGWFSACGAQKHNTYLDTETLLSLCWQHLDTAEERGDVLEEGRLQLPERSCGEPWAWDRFRSSLLHTEQVSPTHNLQSYAGQPKCAVQRGKILPVADTTAVVSALRHQTLTDPHPAELHPRHSSALPLCLPPHRVCSGSSSASPALSPLRAPQPPGEG